MEKVLGAHAEADASQAARQEVGKIPKQAHPTTRRTAMPHDVDINHGVDFEQALERLHHDAGRIFRRYWAAKHGNGSEEEIARLRQAYIDAQRAVKALSPRDEAANSGSADLAGVTRSPKEG